MNRVVCLGMLVLAAGCVVAPERAPLRPLPEDSKPLAYGDLVGRARLLASAGNEAFYINRWSDLEESARGLEQTARFLLKSTEVPAGHKDKLAVEAGDLARNSAKLAEAARAKDVRQANELLQRINLKVRELRADN
jgi:hypothetical protein